MTNAADTLHKERAASLMRRAAIASVLVSAFLLIIKTFAYFASHSVALLASLADSALDLFTSSLNLFAIHQALTPADDEHRFGHGKAEPLAGLAQAAFNRIIAPEPLENSIPALLVMCVAIACAIGLILYQRSVVAKTGSVALEADKTHYLGDLATNIGVVLALVLTIYAGWTLADPLIAIAVALIMSWSAWGVGRTSMDQLMDHELPVEERAQIARIVRGHGAVRSLHDLKTRKAGLSVFIQVHLELDPDMKLAEAHAISDEVERDLMAAFPGAEVIIHQDPEGLEMAKSE